MRKIASLFAMCAAVVALTLSLTGCGMLDGEHFKGTWKVQDSNPQVTVIYTGSEFKNSADTWTYSLGTFSNTISFSYEDSVAQAHYSFNEDYTVLSVTQTDEDGNEVTTVFEKLSDDTTGKPSVG